MSSRLVEAAAAEQLEASRRHFAQLSDLASRMPGTRSGGVVNENAAALWNSCEPIESSPAVDFVRARMPLGPGALPLRFALRAYSTGGAPQPCLVAAITTSTGHVEGCRLLYLNEGLDGLARLPRPALTIGRAAGGAIRFGPDPVRELAIGERLFDCGRFSAATGGSVWAAGDPCLIPAMHLPSSVKRLTILFSQRPGHFQRASLCAVIFQQRGYSVTLAEVRPYEPAANSDREDDR